MASSTPQELVDNIATDLRRSIAAIELALGGLRELVDKVASAPRFAENPDPVIMVGRGAPEAPGARAHGQMRVSELVDQSAKGGAVERLLVQQWVVATFTQWESDYRPTLAASIGVLVNDVVSDLFGDLRNLRNDIVHHRGVATRANAGRNRLLTRSKVGVPIHLDAEDFLTIGDNITIGIAESASGSGRIPEVDLVGQVIKRNVDRRDVARGGLHYQADG